MELHEQELAGAVERLLQTKRARKGGSAKWQAMTEEQRASHIRKMVEAKRIKKAGS